MPTDLVLRNINSAKQFLEKAKSLQELKHVMALADAAGIYAKRIHASTETQNYAAEVRLRAERKLGEVLAREPKNTGTRTKGGGKGAGGTIVEPPATPTLADIGVSKKLSSRAQALAAVPEQRFEAAMSPPPGIELSPGRIATAFQREQKEAVRERHRAVNAEAVAKAPDPSKTEARYSTIVIDPPWDWGDEGDVDQMGRARPTYTTMPLAELLKLPVARLTDKDAHLYLWITNRSLPKGFELLDAWGFRYVTCLTWVKPSIGMGNYFRGSTEHLLFGVRGSQPLKRKNVGTWFGAPRGKVHSAKPDELYALVESCSPGPYLEMFARGPRKGWSVWGAEA